MKMFKILNNLKYDAECNFIIEMYNRPHVLEMFNMATHLLYKIYWIVMIHDLNLAEKIYNLIEFENNVKKKINELGINNLNEDNLNYLCDMLLTVK